ncbi:MAG: DsbA family oxidoreductase [Roseinatronobacter sp.]
MIRLDIYSDPICPWCYIGKARLDRALESRPAHPFELHWRPFQLNPDMPPDGMARARYLALKFGSDQGILNAYRPVVEAAAEIGLPLDLPAIQRTPNTFKAHQLIHWAGLEGRATHVVSALFRAYFRDGRDIGDADVLLDVAGAAGLERDMIARLLASGADADVIRDADQMARVRGVQAVPVFILGQDIAITGAQPSAVWQQVIDDLAQQAGAQ